MRDATSAALLRAAPVAVACGFPSPAQDYYDGPIDLTEMLVDDQAATFIVRAPHAKRLGASAMSSNYELYREEGARVRRGMRVAGDSA